MEQPVESKTLDRTVGLVGMLEQKFLFTTHSRLFENFGRVTVDLTDLALIHTNHSLVDSVTIQLQGTSVHSKKRQDTVYGGRIKSHDDTLGHGPLTLSNWCPGSRVSPVALDFSLAPIPV